MAPIRCITLLFASCLAGFAFAPTAHAQALPDPSVFSADDILEPTALAGRLAAQSEPVASDLWARFTAGVQGTLADATASQADHVSALVDGLNSVLDDGQLYDLGRFADVTLSPETEMLRMWTPDAGGALARFNRLLLEDAYHEELRKSPTGPYLLPAGTGVGTPRSDYAPGATAPIRGWGFAAGETVLLQVLHADGTSNAGHGHLPWPVVAAADGAFQSTWHVCEDDCLGSTLRITATGQSSGLTADCLFTDSLPAPRLETLHPFGNTAFGIYPMSRLTQGQDGALYSTAESEGRLGRGTVFRVNTDGSDVRVLADFNYQIGAFLDGPVVQAADGALYGVTFYGGCGFYGTVFKVDPDGSNFTTLHSFSYSDGAYLYRGLVEGSDGALYGTTVVGGGAGNGTVFKLNPDGSGFTTLHDFNNATDGSSSSALIQATDGMLYGANESGGPGGFGTVYRMHPDGTGFTTLHDFDTAASGTPRAGVLEGADGKLYGTTYGDVVAGELGTVYSLNKDGSDFTTLHSFGWVDGAWPNSELIQDAAGALYGTSSHGGFGTVFRIDPDGSNFSTLHKFDGTPSDGRNPQDGVILGADGALYGTTIYGGMFGRGTLFKVNPDGTGFAQLLNFFNNNSNDPAKGASPCGVPEHAADGRIYGTTYAGGGSGDGTVFAVHPDGNGFSVLYTFAGASPRAGVIQATDGALYGTTDTGGSSSYGTVFKVNTDGYGFVTLHDFLGSDGAHPCEAELIEASDGMLYGTTRDGGSSDNGTVFKLNPNGTGFATLHHFNSADGKTPNAGVLEGMDGLLYGTTSQGGSGTYGTVFRLNPDGTGFVTIHDFDNADGANPFGELIQGADETLYGTTRDGGSSSLGTVFRVNPDGTGFASLHSFDNSDGAHPQGRLAEANGVLYGTTHEGGSSGFGTVFGLKTDGTEFTSMRTFTGSGNGSYPLAGLARGTDGNVYGTTAQGGRGELGTLFRLALVGRPTARAGVDFSVNEGQSVMLDGSDSSVSNGAALHYEWQQLSGTPVTLSNTIAAQPTFTSPFVALGGETLSFRLTVMVDSSSCGTDTVNVTVVNVNHPPVADAGDDQNVAEGCPVTLHGEDSFDIDNDPFSYTWVQVSGTVTVALAGDTTANPTFTTSSYGSGASGVVDTLVFELTVADGFPFDEPVPGYAFSNVTDSVTVEVTRLNNDPIANANLDQTVAEYTSVALDGSLSSDPDSDPLTYSWAQTAGPSVVLSDATSVMPNFTAPFVSVGGADLVFELTVADGVSGSAVDTVVVHVQNANDPPLVGAARPSIAKLWPPNHRLVAISIEGVSDPEANATITIDGVWQDEPTSGLGSGDTAIDAFINVDGTVLLRAERSGTGDGRVYHVHFTATDFEGSVSGVVTVCVPHSKKSVAVDGGQLHVSTN